MNLHFEQSAPSVQAPRPLEPFDRWLSPEGEETSLFYRESDQYLVRFPDRADFLISLDRQTVTCTPTPERSSMKRGMKVARPGYWEPRTS